MDIGSSKLRNSLKIIHILLIIDVVEIDDESGSASI
jgi:hypothetical protein